METKLREIKIEEYWPLILKNTDEFQQIAVAENPEFNKLAECIYRVLEDGFIHDATEYGVSRWESILKLTPAETDTLDDRKARILTYLNIKLPYTWRVLKQMLTDYLDENQFTLDYINDEGKLVLHTDRISDDKLETINTLLEKVIPANIEVVRYNHNIEVSWRDLNKYAECVTNADIAEVNPDWKNDITSDGEWFYPLTKYIPKMIASGRGLFSEAGAVKVSNLYFYTEASTKGDGGGIHLCSNNKNLKKVVIEQPNLADIRYCFVNCTNLEEAYIYMPENKAANVFHAFDNCFALKKLHLVLPKGVVVDHGGAEVNAEWLCRASKLDSESVIRLLNSLPDKSANSKPYLMGLGIHVDYKQDEELLAAIAAAEAKNWSLTIVWNGASSSGVATTDLEEIYAKVTELEHGEYTDENGTRCSLDWGHYVTDTTGYKLFFSLVEAEQYFKLTRIENNE